MPNHKWEPNGMVDGNQNTGIGGSAIQQDQKCARCGVERQRVIRDCNQYGNRNHGWRYRKAGVIYWERERIDCE